MSFLSTQFHVNVSGYTLLFSFVRVERMIDCSGIEMSELISHFYAKLNIKRGTHTRLPVHHVSSPKLVNTFS
jgi:hypothetical protein